MVNNAADRGVMQAHRTANLRQAVTMVKMRIGDGLIALRFIRSGRGAKECTEQDLILTFVTLTFATAGLGGSALEHGVAIGRLAWYDL